VQLWQGQAPELAKAQHLAVDKDVLARHQASYLVAPARVVDKVDHRALNAIVEIWKEKNKISKNIQQTGMLFVDLAYCN
jgi:hypothetical protein